MRKLIIFLLIILILLPTSAKAQKDFAKLRLPAKAISGLFAYLSDVVVEEDTEVAVIPCNCKGKGKVSLDGGGSWIDCPATNCLAKAKGDVVSDSIHTLNYSDYYLVKFSAKWCGGCKVWDRGVRKSLKALGINTVEIDVDKNPNKGVSVLPTIWICTVKDQKAYNAYKFVSPSHAQVVAAIAKLDKELHPTSVSDVSDVVGEVNGVRYVGDGGTKWSIDGDSTPSRGALLTHLRYEVKHKAVRNWPLDELTTEELKAIHDDSHNGKLGKLLPKAE